MLPIPNHLKNILTPTGEFNCENEVIGKIVCPCGTDIFQIKYVGDHKMFEHLKAVTSIEKEDHFYLIVKVNCCNCSKEHLIFDNDLHGWDGFLTGMKTEFTPASTTLKCYNCEHENHSIFITINSQGKDDFLEETGDEFKDDDWKEAFEWIRISTSCEKCNFENIEWISQETM